LPSGQYEVALAIQDRAIGSDGALQYPAAWQEDFFGDKILVNGKVWPYLNVDRAGTGSASSTDRIRARTRLRSPTTQASSHRRRWRLAVGAGHDDPTDTRAGERADLAVDFADYAAGTQILLETRAGAVSGRARCRRRGAGHEVRGRREFRARGAAAFNAQDRRAARPANAVVERTLELRKVDDACGGSAWTINGLRWRDPVTELPLLGTTEIWRFVNRSGMAHPMHLHLSMFQIIDRQAFTVVNGEIVPSGSATPPAPWESGWKDTVLVNAFEIVRVVVPFEDYAGYYPFHCHVLEHEDHDMMRQFQTRTDVIFSSGFETP
jgi:spore coat protein A